ncbi:MAG: exo-alpha-sialidase [Solitalea sp.]
MNRCSTKHFLLFLCFNLLILTVPRPGAAAADSALYLDGSTHPDGLAHSNRPAEVVQEWFQLPVLKYKPDNPVLRVRVKANRETSLTGFLIGTEGTTRPEDISAIRIYYDRREKGGLQLDTKDKQVTLFGTVSGAGKKNRIPGRLRLPRGTHTFWVSFELSPSADLTHQIGVSCLRVSLGKTRIRPEAVGGQQPLRMGAAVRLHGQDGVHTSRIPGLATTNKGTLLAVFDARHDSARDLQGDIDIGLHRSTDGGNTWEPIRIAMDRGEWGGLPQKYNGISDACILVDRNSDAIYLAGLWMHGVLDTEGNWVEGLTEADDEWNHQWRNRASQPGFDVKQTSQFLIVKSTDDGKTWGEPVNLTRMIKKPEWWLLAPAPGNGITLEDGTLVFPTQGRNETGKPFSNITYSTDGGKTWVTSAPATEAVQTATNECAVVQLSDGSLMLNMRAGINRGNTGADNGRGIATTRDLGRTWQPHPGSFHALPEPTCMASLYRHDYTENKERKSVLVFSNPNSKEFRENITIKLSPDDGDTWPRQYQVLLDEGRGRGYSCLTSVGREYIGILYESSQADLVFQKIPLKELLEGSKPTNE